MSGDGGLKVGKERVVHFLGWNRGRSGDGWGVRGMTPNSLTRQLPTTPKGD